MSKKLLLVIIATVFSALLHAQTARCAFENLFTIKPGMSKPTVVDTINSRYSNIKLVNTESEKRPPYGSGGDSIVLETLTYKAGGIKIPCFNGTNNVLRMDFADDKLYKAYIGTEYSQLKYPDLMSNFNALRNSIKKSWKFEHEIKVSGSNVEGFGYAYTKNQEKTNKPETCTLQYVKIKGSSPSADKYILEVIWANLQNTRMEGSAY
ncbi:hypothetical protein QTN47_16265 [Danxiaibacter flavus]|uniref:Uncharacterized protein n=1 Tax=Danxiaibacter flavus TaxID=3049108 RepID=A0ABV3ZGM2_9BACT|nr:hypothetical protein QNM32_16275 [Chitinophagaceae bacterium DXS]